MKETTAEKDPRALAKLRDLIGDIHVGMMTTVTPDGALRSRPMLTQRVGDDDAELWFFTAADSAKARDIAEEHAVNVSYADSRRHRYVSVTGNAAVVHDPAKAGEMWDAKLTAWFPPGLDDPRLALVRVRVESAEYWDMTTGKMVELQDGPKGLAGAHHRRRDGDGTGEHTTVDIRGTPSSG